MKIKYIVAGVGAAIWLACLGLLISRFMGSSENQAAPRASGTVAGFESGSPGQAIAPGPAGPASTPPGGTAARSSLDMVKWEGKGFSDSQPGAAAIPSSVIGRGGIEWVLIPGGTYTMGLKLDAADAAPAHRVSVRPFYIARTEVTNRQYRACVSAGACTPPGACKSHSAEYEHPVECIDWGAARAFAAWAGGRLPSEAEWEYAATSGGKPWDYPWGDEKATCDRAVIDDGGPGCGRNGTWAVCSKPAGNTVHGLCDMAGNVGEWVQDWHHKSYLGAPADGTAWENPEGSERVVRGGSWYFDEISAWAAYRVHFNPGSGYSNIGLRPARDIPESAGSGGLPEDERRSLEGATKGNLGAIRSALSIFYGDAEGVYPSDMRQLIDPEKYLKAIPFADTGHHPRSNAVVSACASESRPGRLLDTGGWAYCSDVRDKEYGMIVVDCTHRDSKGRPWHAY